MNYKKGLPQFDWIFLGLGADGHTASLFPNAPEPQEREAICLVAEHPQTGQKRISLTLPVINSTRRITFLVTGSGKRAVLEQIFKRKEGIDNILLLQYSRLPGRRNGIWMKKPPENS